MKLPVWLSNVLDGGWPLWIIVAALVAIGLPLFLWALFSDRARGRRRCPRCWYDLRGTPSLRCSECGYEAKRERSLLRTRRRWKWAAAGALALVACIALPLASIVWRRGWIELVPTAILLQLDAGRAADHDRQNAPNLDWIQGGLVDRDAGFKMTGAQWRDYLLRSGAIQTRKMWPVDVPLALTIVPPRWTWFELLAQQRGATHHVQFGLVTDPMPVNAQSPAELWVREIGPLGPEDESITLSCNLRAAALLTGRFFKNDVSFSLDLPVKPVPTLHDAISPLGGPEIDKLMRRALSPSIVFRSAGGGLSDSFDLGFRRSIDPRLKPVTFGFSVEFLRGRESTLSLSMAPPYPPDDRDDEVNSLRLNSQTWSEVKTLLRAAPATIRITGNAILGLQDWDRTHYWAGTVEYNLHQAFRDE